jgi:mannose-6-phosphate isomerase-like protein (cupin superfamily)
MITTSHQFRQSIQEVRHLAGVQRDDASTDDILRWARERNNASKLVTPEMADGEALFFDGWLWHASHNTGNKIRTALLLQYSTPDTPIRIPDPNNFEWPFKTLQYPKPPCIMVSGSDHFGVNRIVPPPASHDGLETYGLTNQIYSIDIPLASDEKTGWKPYPIFRGATPNLQGLTCHASALMPGHTPHPPHQHREEEILILLKGDAEVTLPDLAAKGLATAIRLKPGEFVYYPAWFYHTITARGESPANYLMFKWYNKNGGMAEQPSPSFGRRRGQKGGTAFAKAMAVEDGGTERKLKYGKYSTADYFNSVSAEKLFFTQHVFQAPTDCLHALQCHTSTILPGGGYEAHSDAHDVAIVVLKGEVETLNTRVGPNSVLFFPAGHLHDMRNPTEQIAEYLVFEFHGNHPPPVKRKRKTLLEKMKDPKSWKNKFSEIRNRFR